MDKYKKYFPDFAWEDLLKVVKKYNLKPADVGKWIEGYKPQSKYFPAANIYSMLENKTLREKFSKMDVSKIKDHAKSKGIYTVWTDGKAKNKEQLIESIMSYTYDPKNYIKTQTKQSGKTEPVIAKPPKLSEMTQDQLKLNKLKLDDLRSYCKKYGLSCLGKKHEIIDELIEELDSDDLAKIFKEISNTPKPKSKTLSKTKAPTKTIPKSKTSPPKTKKVVKSKPKASPKPPPKSKTIPKTPPKPKYSQETLLRYCESHKIKGCKGKSISELTAIIKKWKGKRQVFAVVELEEEPTKAPAKAPTKKSDTVKKCPSDKILNPATGRCVLKTGKIGQSLLKKK